MTKSGVTPDAKYFNEILNKLKAEVSYLHDSILARHKTQVEKLISTHQEPHNY